MSFNIRYDNRSDGRYRWDKRKAKVVEKLKLDAPDIVGFQEALISQVEYLEEQLPEYSWVGAGREDGAQIGEFTPIFYRDDTFQLITSGTQWLSESPNTPSVGWDASHKRIATWAMLEMSSRGEQLLFINTHFDHKGTQARTNSSQLLVDLTDSLTAIYTDAAVVIVGDFNARASDKTLHTLVESFDYAMTSCIDFTCCHAAPTYIGFPYATVTPRAIDHIFIRGLDVESYYVDVENYGLGFLSDHRSIMAIVRKKRSLD